MSSGSSCKAKMRNEMRCGGAVVVGQWDGRYASGVGLEAVSAHATVIPKAKVVKSISHPGINERTKNGFMTCVLA